MKTKELERKKMVIAMEYIARQINDEDIFMEWLSLGVADGDINYGDFNPESVDDFYIEDDNFRYLMDTFLGVMRDSRESGGLFCGGVVTRQG